MKVGWGRGEWVEQREERLDVLCLSPLLDEERDLVCITETWLGTEDNVNSSVIYPKVSTFKYYEILRWQWM